MFESVERSWNLAKESLGVIRKDPELMIFPIVSFIAGVIVAGILGTAAFFTNAFNGDDTGTAIGIVLVFLFYFVTYFLTIYFQVALVAAVKLRLSGGNPTLGYGIAEANKRLGAIASWAIIAAIVGLILRLLEGAARRNGGLGGIVAQIAIGLVGMAWSLATFFVIPVIAYEGVGGFEAIKRSAGVIKRRWGEAVVGQAGIGLIMIGLALLLGVVFGIPGVLLLVNGGTVGVVLGILLIAVAVLGVLLIVVLSATLQSVYTAALYEYATKGQAPSIFSQSALDSAFRPKH
jgi:hypothetical protein